MINLLASRHYDTSNKDLEVECSSPKLDKIPLCHYGHLLTKSDYQGPRRDAVQMMSACVFSPDKLRRAAFLVSAHRHPVLRLFLVRRRSSYNQDLVSGVDNVGRNAGPGG